jgi:predicted adenylyl cyclase CyaB
MARNLEIKARLDDPPAMLARVAALADGPGETIEQEDTFFAVPYGRLKLRVFASGVGELIYYERDDERGPKESRYLIAPVAAPGPLCDTLTAALGQRGSVRKTRRLYHVGQTRVHLDEVVGLGWFLELEVVLREEQQTAEGEAIAAELMTRLGISREALLSGAYVDLAPDSPSASALR